MNFRVPEFSGSPFFQLISGIIFRNPKFVKPKLPDPKISGKPNAQPYICTRPHTPGHHPTSTTPPAELTQASSVPLPAGGRRPAPLAAPPARPSLPSPSTAAAQPHKTCCAAAGFPLLPYPGPFLQPIAARSNTAGAPSTATLTGKHPPQIWISFHPSASFSVEVRDWLLRMYAVFVCSERGDT